MEIGEFLRAKRWWALLLVVLPVLAAGLAYGPASNQPRRYEARLTLVVPDALAGSGNDLGFLVADLEQLVRTEEVRRAVAERAGPPFQELTGDIDVQRLGQSSSVELRVTALDPERAERVVEAAAREGLEGLARQDLELVQEQAATVEEQYEAARAELAAARQRTGVLDAGDALEDAGGRLVELQDRLDERRVDRAVATDAEAAAAADADIALLEQRLAATRADEQRLRGEVPEFDRLEDRLNDVLSFRRDASRALLGAQTVLTTTEEGDLYGDVTAYALRRRTAILQAMVGAAAIALLGAFGLLLLPDLLRLGGRRPRATTHDDDDDDDDPDWDPDRLDERDERATVSQGSGTGP